MKIKILIFLMLLCAISSRVSSQTYSVSDSVALLAIDVACDASDSLNWDTEPDPGNWDGVTWNSDNPKRVSELYVNNKSLTDVIDVTALTSLTDIQCSYNQLTGLDPSTLTDLTYLSCSNNQITALDVSALTNLTYLGCATNQISSLDLSALTNLLYLRCFSNQLTGLDVSALTNLTKLYCQSNQLTMLDVSTLTNLTYLGCAANQISSLDLSALTNLTELECSINQLTSLDVSALFNLTGLYCSYNQLATLDVSALAYLTNFWCDNNQLTGLDVSSLANLTELYCQSNQITVLSISELTNLTELYCSDNQLTELDVSSLTNLAALECYGNRLPFSSLATGLHVGDYTYSPQDTLFEPESISGNTTIDYSAEALIDGTATQFVFYKDGSEAETNTTGLFTTTGPGEYFCSMSNAKFPDLTLTTAAVTITEVTGVEDVPILSYYLYPNPVKDKLNIRLTGNDLPSMIGIYTMSGKQLMFIESKSSLVEIDMGTLQPGIYILKIVTPGSSIVEEIVKL